MTHPPQHTLSERELGLLVRNQLNAGLNDLSKQQSERLFQARQAALSHYPASESRLSLASLGHSGLIWYEEKLRPLLVASALVLAVVVSNQVLDQQHEADLVDIDAALLSDELPISAYLDHGFQSWLADSSRH